jgi:hypothetical protein
MVSDTTLAVVNVVASCTALYMCMSPAPTMVRILKRKRTGHMPALPIVAQWAYNHIWYRIHKPQALLAMPTYPLMRRADRMLYGLLTNAYFPLFATYAVGSLLSVAFLAIFFYGSENDRKAHVAQLIAVTLLFNIATSCYAFLGPRVQQAHHVEQIVGVLAIACGLALYASPFATIRVVLTTKNAISIPVGMVLVGTISNATWIVYGALMDDYFIVGPTIVNTCLCVAQLLLYVAFRPGRRRKTARSRGSQSESTSPDSSSPSSRSRSSGHDQSFVMLETPKTAGGTHRVHDIADRA